MARWVVLFGLLALASGCHTPFSRGFRENHRLKTPELKKIQFYTSATIVLRRSENSQSRKLEDHSFDIRGQVAVEEIEISAGTPCVAVEVRGEYIGVSFTPGDRERVLWFSTVRSPQAGRYALTHVQSFPTPQATSPRYSPGYAIRYGAHDYQLVTPESWDVYLLFDEDVSLDRCVRKRSAAGWTLGEAPKASGGASGDDAECPNLGVQTGQTE